MRIYWKQYHLQRGSHFSYIAVNFHLEMRIYRKTLPFAGGSHFSYIAANFHYEVRICWKTLPLAMRQSHFSHCSKFPLWIKNLLKNRTTCRKAVNFLTLQQTSIMNEHEVRIYWKILPIAGRQPLSLHCSKFSFWNENLLKNITTCRAAVTFLTLH